MKNEVPSVSFMTPQRVLVMLFAFTTGLSFALTLLQAQGMKESETVSLGSSVGFSVLIFMWYWFDSQARAFTRTPWMNVAVVAVAFVGIPWYLFRSRAVDQRREAFGNLFIVVVLLIVSMIGGGLLATLV